MVEGAEFGGDGAFTEGFEDDVGAAGQSQVAGVGADFREFNAGGDVEFLGGIVFEGLAHDIGPKRHGDF